MGKLGPTSPSPIQKTASWGSLRTKSADNTPSYFPTTYTEEGLVGKLGPTSPSPIQKTASWGSSRRSLIMPPLLPRRAGTPSALAAFWP